MSMTALLSTTVEKLRWGVQVVGPMASLRGAWRTVRLLATRPSRARVQLRCGPVVEFDYPSQFPPALMMFGDLIDPEFSFLKQVARPHWRILDVGAAIGQFSLFAAVCLPQVAVDAFEPSGANVATLRRNLRSNHVDDRVVVHQTALSHQKGVAQFATAARTWLSQLTTSDSPGAGLEEVTVNTLDSVLDELFIDRVDVLKINVAGFEPAVIEGAMRSLREKRVTIMVLLLGLPSLPLYAAIAALGYRFFYYHPGRQMLFEVDRFDPDSVLGNRPWPARHIIAIDGAAVESLIVGRITISPRASAGSDEGPAKAPRSMLVTRE